MPRSDADHSEEFPRIGHNGGPALDDLLSMTIRTAMRITGFSKDALYDFTAVYGASPASTPSARPFIPVVVI